MFSLLKFNLFVFIILIKGFSFQYTDDCYDYNSNGTFGCYVRPGLCKNKDCEYIVKWQDKTTFLNFQIIYRVDDTTINFASAYAALGFSYDMDMGNDSVVMCRVTNNSRTMAVETYYNDNYSKSDTLLNDNRTIGVSNGTIMFSDRFILCSFSRVKSIQGQVGFFNLSNPFYILVSYGQTNSLGSPIWHGPNAHDSHVQQNFQSLVNADPGTTTILINSTTAAATTRLTTKLNSGNIISTNFYLKGFILLINSYIFFIFC